MLALVRTLRKHITIMRALMTGAAIVSVGTTLFNAGIVEAGRN